MSRTGVAVVVLAIIVGACSSGSSATEQPVVACASASDCFGTAVSTGSTVWCCLDKACAFSSGASIVDCTDANAQIIEASNYDQSCKTDSDCVAVAEGNACDPGFRNCPTATINVGDMAKYNADVAMTNAASCGALSGCLDEPSPCCNGGACVTDNCQRQPAPPCMDTAGCATGQVCCLANEITMSTACQAAPCPDLPTRGPVQLCSTATECLGAGDVCVSLAIGQAKSCYAPDGGTEAGVGDAAGE